MNPFPQRREPLDGGDPSLFRFLGKCLFVVTLILVLLILFWPAIHGYLNP